MGLRRALHDRMIESNENNNNHTNNNNNNNANDERKILSKLEIVSCRDTRVGNTAVELLVKNATNLR